MSTNIIPLQFRATALAMADLLRERINNDFPSPDVTIGTGVSDRGANAHRCSLLVETNLTVGHNSIGDVAENENVDDNEQIEYAAIDYHHHSCVDHGLNNCVKDCFSLCGTADSKTRHSVQLVKTLVSTIRGSDSLHGKVKVEAAKMGFAARSLIQEVDTRWCSLYYCLQRFLELLECIEVVLGKDLKLSKLLPSREQVDIVKSVAKCLKQLSHLSVLSEGEKYVTAAHFPQWLKSVLEWLAVSHTKVHDNHRKILNDALEKRLGYLLTTPNVCLLAAAVHPKHRVNRHLNFVTEELREKIWLDIAEEACIYNPPSDDPTVQALWRSSTTSQVQAFRRHLSTSVPEDADPLIFFPQKCGQFSMLFPFLKQVLSIPATSAPSERLFKPSKRTVTKDRNRITPEHVEMFSVIRCYVNENRDENGRFEEGLFYSKVKDFIEKQQEKVRLLDENLQALQGEEESSQ